jgi:hypothetical protein
VVAKEEGVFVARPPYDKAKRKAEVKGAHRPHAPTMRSPFGLSVEISKKRRAKEAAAAIAPPSIAAASAPRAAPSIAPAPAPFPVPSSVRPLGFGAGLPHKILFVQNLPQMIALSVLTALFTQFPGFREVRLIEARPGIAFVEYDDEVLASAALSGLQGFRIEDEPIILSFANR